MCLASVGTAALVCLAGRSRAALLCARMGERKPRRARFAGTAGVGCPYVGFGFSCKLTRDETPPLPPPGAPAALLDIPAALLDPVRIRIRLQRSPQARCRNRD